MDPNRAILVAITQISGFAIVQKLQLQWKSSQIVWEGLRVSYDLTQQSPSCSHPVASTVSFLTSSGLHVELLFSLSHREVLPRDRLTGTT